MPNLNAKSEAGGEPDVELVTVPKFGAEWTKDELKGMTKSGKSNAKSQRRRDVWKAWTRGEHGFFGGILTRKVLVFVLFGLALAAAILLAITLPRVPSFDFNSQVPFRPTAPADGESDGPERYKTAFSRVPAVFNFNAWMDLRMNTRSSIVGLHFDKIEVQVYEANDFKLVATGNITGLGVKAKANEPMLFPLTFAYDAVNTSDPTWLRFYDACNNHVNHDQGVRPGIDVRVVIEMWIRGLIGSRSTSTQISGVACPIELPTDSA